MTVTKDGVTVAKSIQLLDSVENIAVIMMQQAADKTATSAGDGTTTAIVLTEALVKSALEVLEKHPDCNKTEVLRELVSSTNVIVDKLKKMSKPVDSSKVKQVATISASTDDAIGSIIGRCERECG